jgi:hypothetical protein
MMAPLLFPEAGTAEADALLVGSPECLVVEVGGFEEAVGPDCDELGPPAVEDGDCALMQLLSSEEPMGKMSVEPPERPCASVRIKIT